MPLPGVEMDGLVTRPQYSILKQRVELDIDFARQSLKGSTELTVQPLASDLRQIQLHCRQCRPTLVQVGGVTAKWEHEDPYRRLRMPEKANIHQYEMLKTKIQTSLRPSPATELWIALPPKLRIQELRVDPITTLPLQNGTAPLQRQESDAVAIAETPVLQNIQQQIPQFAPIKLTIEFEVNDFRDGLHWVGCDGRDKAIPHLYTKLDALPGNTSCIFPCLDTTTSRCTWEISIRCPKTLGDAFRRSSTTAPRSNSAERLAASLDVEMVNGDGAGTSKGSSSNPLDQYYIDLAEKDAVLDLTVLCGGELSDDVVDSEDESRHTMTFNLNEPVTARHVAFAIGPFEHFDLTVHRAVEEEEKLGQTAVKADGYCLFGRREEVGNACYPICDALDLMGVNFGRFPFSSYQMLFVDDVPCTISGAAGFSICNTRLLFPERIIEPLDANTRVLVRAVADQWSGVNIIPKEPADTWAIAGIAGYMTDVYMKKLSGNNEYRWKQKQAAEKIYELDVDRPSMHQLGNLVHLDDSIADFINLKSAVVLGILDRRLIKSSGSTGVTRIISKIFLNARTGSLSNRELSTQDFQRTCERLGHNKLEAFFRQWVMGAGCPIFYVTQRFNKKKLMVELRIQQKQLERITKPPFEPSNFMREAKEHVQEVWAPEPQNLFTGPMTIRIHEADGTPYEHIVEIKEATTLLEIPYNTKYKRLKRSKRQKERLLAENNAGGEGGEDSLVYCLGGILDTPDEVQDWNLADWSKEDEEKMGGESYEWIRMDADFEWIGKMHLVMPLYMYVSQLQQDRDIVAQYESMRYLLGSNPHHVSLSILVRTLMDSRYFHGIRCMAAEGLAIMAKDRLRNIAQHHLEKAFSEMFCEEGSIMPLPNDFSDRVMFIMQCAIPKAMANLRDEEAKVPERVRKFFVDKLRFNDNSENDYSDVHYIATLMECLTDALVASHRKTQPAYHFGFDDDEPMEPENPDAEFETTAVNEIERYRLVDEYDPSYRHVYSTTAITCLQKLTKAGIVKNKTKELILYTKASTADDVRLQAFQSLNEIGFARKPTMVKHLLHSLADDSSPYFRNRLLQIFGETLGHVALGDDAVEKAAPPPPPTDNLILEEEVNTQARHLEVTRKTTPEGAILALKTILQNDEVFKKALWRAATAPDLALDEVAAFCDIAALIFEPVTSLPVTLKLPKPYKCEHLGHCKMRFYQQGSYRMKPVVGLALEDWLEMQKLGLKYTGALSEQTMKFIEDQEQQERERLEAGPKKLNLKRPEPETAPWNGPIHMPPPSLPTPTTERSGIRLSLGGAGKRKASVEREASPKPAKMPKITMSNTMAGPASHKKSVPAPKQPRRSSTPFTKTGTGPLLVKLRVTNPKIALKMQENLSKAPERWPTMPSLEADATQASRSNTPQQPSPAFAHPSFPHLSPPASSFISPPPQPASALNPGGFRSFGPAPDINHNPPYTASPTEPRYPNSLPSLSSYPASLSSISPPAASTPEATRPKLKLKFSRKPGQEDPGPSV